MRPLELLTPIILAIYLLYPLTGNKRLPAAGILPAFAFIVIVAHANIEGLRWQMIPLYAFTVVTLLLSIPSFLGVSQTADQGNKRIWRISLSLILLVLSTALPILLPVPSIPNPDGSYQVGTRIYELTDNARKELYSGKDEARRFQIQVWYPAKLVPSDERAPWMDKANIFAPAISEYLHLPYFFLDHLALTKIPAYKEAKVSETTEGFPIILFSHGWNGFDAQNTGQALQLASHGYVVAAMQHTYGALITAFNDGTIAKNNPSALPSGVPDDEYGIAARKLGNQWSGDLSFALDFLEEQNQDATSPFYSSLNPSLVGVYGHSTGGGAAIQFCGTDSRCKAMLGMDPFMRPVSEEVLNNGLAHPTFFMFSQVWSDEATSYNNRLFGPFYSRLTYPYGAITIQGTAHYDFTDLPLLSPLAHKLGLKGPINGKRVTTIVDDYLLSFFESTLKGGSRSLFENPSPYSEVKSIK